jgi:hypothetical protein
LRLLRPGALGLAFIVTSALSIPAPDRPIVGAAVLLTFQMEPRDGPEDLQPGRGIAADFDLWLDRTKRVERLIEQVAHDPCLWLISGGANIADWQIIVNSQVALDEAGDLPVLAGAIVALEDEDVAAACGAGIALAPTLVIGVRQSRADRVMQRLRVAGFGGSDAVRQTSFFHCASLWTA